MARTALDKGHRRSLRVGVNLEVAEDAECHQLRIAIKKQRDFAESFAIPLPPRKPWVDRRKRRRASRYRLGAARVGQRRDDLRELGPAYGQSQWPRSYGQQSFGRCGREPGCANARCSSGRNSPDLKRPWHGGRGREPPQRDVLELDLLGRFAETWPAAIGENAGACWLSKSLSLGLAGLAGTGWAIDYLRSLVQPGAQAAHFPFVRLETARRSGAD